MFKILYFILTGILLSNTSFGNNQKVEGDWLLTKIETADGTKEVYAFVTFGDNGDFIAMDMNMGTWKYNKKNNVVEILSDKFKAANGNNNIVKLDAENMILENSGNKMYFQRIDSEKIASDNKNSGLKGTWKAGPDENNVLRIFIFDIPDAFSYVEEEPGVQTTGSGTWIYNKKDNSLLLVARIEDLDNIYKVEKKSENNILLKNDNEVITLVKEKPAAKIENLNFSEDDFFDADGNYKYENDEEKLPWNDFYNMIDYLSGIKQLEYKFSTLILKANVFQTKPLVANVSVDEDQNKICIDFIFYGYDKEHLPDDTALPPNCVSENDYYNKLFPEKEQDFRVAGKENIKVAAGSFQCTVIEAVNGNGTKYKMWMIDDKPGVYAKIIEQDSDPTFGHYHIYELTSIK